MRLIRATLSVMLGDAVEDGLLQTNPPFNSTPSPPAPVGRRYEGRAPAPG